MATFLPFNDVARLPLADYRAVTAWHQRLMGLPAWAEPFAGLLAEELPPISC
jgi:glutathione S-transferase